MSKIYLVSTGEYSEFSILGVFSTKEKVESFCNTFPNSGHYDSKPDIHEYDLDEFDDIIEACKGKKVFNVEMELVDGNVKRVREHTGELWVSQMVLEKKFVVNNGLIQAYVFADSKEHAVKIMAEQRTQIIVQM